MGRGCEKVKEGLEGYREVRERFKEGKRNVNSLRRATKGYE